MTDWLKDGVYREDDTNTHDTFKKILLTKTLFSVLGLEKSCVFAYRCVLLHFYKIL